MANKAGVEDAVMVHKTEIVFCDKTTDKSRFKHYRLNAGNIEKIIFDYVERKTFFGLRKELEERVIFKVKDEDIPEELVVLEHNEPNFRRYRGGIRSFVDDNKVALEIYDAEGKRQS
ncbi:MAG: hypothetical protein IJU75_04110 [Clostridia bacterium]|nr:hypothetical protein [Clostridia bacterium]MBQ7604116.1 hypothetical protein [Clostridia bacterium]